MFGDFGDGACGAEVATAHDGYAVADSEQFGQVTADDQDGAGVLRVAGELVDEFVDCGFSGDVDTPGGFIEEEDFRFTFQEAGERDFLLVTAGEGGGFLGGALAADAEAFDPFPGGAGEFGWGDPAPAAGGAEFG